MVVARESLGVLLQQNLSNYKSCNCKNYALFKQTLKIPKFYTCQNAHLNSFKLCYLLQPSWVPIQSSCLLLHHGLYKCWNHM